MILLGYSTGYKPHCHSDKEKKKGASPKAIFSYRWIEGFIRCHIVKFRVLLKVRACT